MPSALAFTTCRGRKFGKSTILSAKLSELEEMPNDELNLMVMDVVIYEQDSRLKLGAVQENGNVAPLSTWTMESSYETDANDMLAFVVDEDDVFPGLDSSEITVLKRLEGDDILSYGSRQVGGGKGLGNPHGEESEIVYYLDRSVVEGQYFKTTGSDLKISIKMNEELEHLW
ncbi:hypothetical protein THAOC_03553 [Thalassiosira oceanica]|uniref:Uncharacterized protein n=1 Tax=Thalassiosira oceanica TaxID=159749 RepID=K0TB89_THAOC|nr:hypothetical protein THAOC_03553 [Thalassiosira oceanica]|eukprot:EJK74755.1 hypothetical protein THAOC_03553 [Thalassiosira oceanica]